MKHYLVRIFVPFFIIVVIIQATIWFNYFYLDEEAWTSAAHLLAENKVPDKSHLAHGYPGTSILIPASLLIRAGVNDMFAVKVVMVTLISLSITAISIVLFKLRPQSKWWLATAGLLIFSRLYAPSTPPSALVSLLTPLLFVLTLLIYERAQQKQNYSRISIILGIVAGASLATRFDISIPVLFLISTFLFFAARKNLWLVACTAVITFIALNPYLWLAPINYFVDLYEKIMFHAAGKNRASLFFHFSILTRDSFISFLFVFLSTLMLFMKNNIVLVSKTFLAWITVCLVFLYIIILIPHHTPPWFFYPIFLTCETFFPLIVLSLIKKINIPPNTPWITIERVENVVICLLILGHASLLLNNVF